MTVGVTIVALVVAQLVWQLAAADGTLASPLALHVLTGVLRVALGALLTGMVLHRLFGRRPPWPLTMRAHLAGVLVAKAAMWFVASPLVALALFVAGVLVPAALIVRRAG